MPRRWLFLLLAVTISWGCSTQVTVHGTFAQVWSATELAVQQTADEANVSVRTLRQSFSTGEREMVISDGTLDGELHCYTAIVPVGSEQARDHDVRVRVLQVDSLESPRDEEALQSRRREDLETRITRRLTRLLDPPPTEPSEDGTDLEPATEP